MEFIELNKNNIDTEHICCAFSDKKCTQGYLEKKEWLKNQFFNGYKFIKLDARAKVFIEYVDSDYSWLPIKAHNFKIINCFWVSGQFAGKGYGKKLLEFCLIDSKEKDGIIAITGDKKRPFMTDKKFLQKFGFQKVDEALPFFELWCLKNNVNAETPKFLDTAKSGECPNKDGIVVYYSDTCPFNDYYVNDYMVDFAKRHNQKLEIIKIDNQEKGKALPVPWIINSVFYNGKFVSNKIKVDNELLELINHNFELL